MKAYSIGLIILLAAFILGAYSNYVSYRWVLNPPRTEGEMKAWNNDLSQLPLLGLIAEIIGIIGILMFIVEFRLHQHKGSATTIPPPP